MSSKPWWDEEDDFGRPKLDGSKKAGGSSSHMLTFSHHASCFESHKPMVIGDTGLQIYGGSCSRPIVNDADVYIGFDSGMRFRHTLPWAFKPEILYEISDMHAPKEVTNFRKLVSWTAEQLQSGAKVHCGCIGGHGRTGMFFSALVKHMTGIEEATEYVRKHYCRKAVETGEQIHYLHKYFGVSEAKGTKQFIGSSSDYLKPVSASSHKSKGGSKGRSTQFKPVHDGNSIWGNRASS